MIDFILWLILGGIAGWIASMIAGTNAQQGWVMNVVVGIVGALIGGFLVNLLMPGANVGGFNLISLIVAIVGAVILLSVYKMVAGRRA